MSGPGTDVSGELADYMEGKGINKLFLELAENILAARPANPVQFVLAHLVRNYPDMCQVPHVLGYETEEVTDSKAIDAMDADDEDDDDDEDFKPKPIHRRSKFRRGAVSGPSIEPEDISKHVRRRRVPKSKEEAAFLRQVLLKHELFAQLPTERLDLVLAAMAPTMPDDGKVLYTQGQWDSNSMYVVVSGQVNLYQKKDNRGIETVMPYRVGQYFGDIVLMHDTPRAHTAKASGSDVKLWTIDRLTLKLTIMEHVATVRDQRVKNLMNVPIMATLQEKERLAIADALVEEEFDTDDIVFRQNDPGDKTYMIEAGRVAVLQQLSPVSEPKEVCRLGVTAYFGEMSLITDRPRQATVAAVMPTRLLSLDRTIFRRILGPFSDVLKRDKELYATFMAQKL